MVKIESISLEGFKGHKELDIPSSGINIITGRNNVGKTSLLEAIDLSFNPSHIRGYGKNIDKLVNAHLDQAIIRSKYRHQRDQQRLTDYSENQLLTRETRLVTPDEAEIANYLTDIILRQVDEAEIRKSSSRRSINNLTNVDDMIEYQKSFEKNAKKYVKKALESTLTEENLSDFASSSLQVSVDQREYPYVYLGDEYQMLIEAISRKSVNEFASDVEITDEEVIDSIMFNLERTFRRAIWGRHGRGVYLETPPENEGVRFVESLDITEKDIETEDEYAVILTEIEDFLKENNIVKGLRDFHIDALVFEENGQRYQIPYEFMGDGFKSIIGLLWELKREGKERSVVLLEEPENHMHPGYINTLVTFLIEISKKEDLQLFITTHNMDFIDEFFETDGKDREYLEEEFQLILMQQDLTQVLPYKLAEEDLKELHVDLRGL